MPAWCVLPGGRAGGPAKLCLRRGLKLSCATGKCLVSTRVWAGRSELRVSGSGRSFVGKAPHMLDEVRPGGAEAAFDRSVIAPGSAD